MIQLTIISNCPPWALELVADCLTWLFTRLGWTVALAVVGPVETEPKTEGE